MGFLSKIGKAFGGGPKLPGAGALGGALGAMPGAKAVGGALGAMPGGKALGGALGMPGVGGGTPAPGAAPGGLAGKFASIKKPTAIGDAISIPGPSLAAAPDLGGGAAMSAGPALDEKALGKKSIFGHRAMRGGRR